MKTLVSTTLAALALSIAAVSAAEAAEGWARSSGALRAGPGNSYPAIDRIAAGEDLTVHGCLRRWTWCDVSVDGDRGWFPGRKIAIESQGRRVELPTVATIVGLGILGFERDVYWRDHYRERSFYRPSRGYGERYDGPRPERPRAVMPAPDAPRGYGGAEPRPPRDETRRSPYPQRSERPVRVETPFRPPHQAERPERPQAPEVRAPVAPRGDQAAPRGPVRVPAGACTTDCR